MNKDLFKIVIKNGLEIVGSMTTLEFRSYFGDPKGRKFLSEHINNYNEDMRLQKSEFRAYQELA